MTKDEYIMKVLNKVKWLREPADHLISLMEQNQLTSEYKDYLYNHFTVAIHNAVVKKREEQQASFSQHIQSIHAQEEETKQAEENDVDSLENLLDTMY